jgi:hypothetical protein
LNFSRRDLKNANKTLRRRLAYLDEQVRTETVPKKLSFIRAELAALALVTRFLTTLTTKKAAA